jgi:hypothetical protein
MDLQVMLPRVLPGRRIRAPRWRHTAACRRANDCRNESRP